MLGRNMQVQRVARTQIQLARLLAGQLRPQPTIAQLAAAQT